MLRRLLNRVASPLEWFVLFTYLINSITPEWFKTLNYCLKLFYKYKISQKLSLFFNLKKKLVCCLYQFVVIVIFELLVVLAFLQQEARYGIGRWGLGGPLGCSYDSYLQQEGI